ncbi:MAG: BamA/TamA family outer membrane protein, partial [Betaproteobacteria bacterium]|nr:BamA/TamA family outer membrane protein [Betaproteobacteria bacterium]MBV9359937.1 BamA/TamA family outer membrane protein [Betaproteobacteria bacterium]
MRWLAAAACSTALAVHAAEPAQLAREIGIDPSKELAETRLIEDVVVAPIPISNPTVGTGLAVVVMPFYYLGPDSPLSNTAVAAGYTSSGSWALGAAQTTRLRGDELRVDGLLAFFELRYNFFGKGAEAGEAGRFVPISQKAAAFVPELLFQWREHLFLGVRYRGIKVETALDTTQVPPELAPFIDVSGAIASSGVGPVAVLDTRDNEMNPARGWLAEFRGNFAEHTFGSDTSYTNYSASANHYLRAGLGVLALRAYVCGASERTPLFDLCLYGAGNDLRGYEIGRYRDRAMFATQAEYRFPL